MPAPNNMSDTDFFSSIIQPEIQKPISINSNFEKAVSGPRIDVFTGGIISNDGLGPIPPSAPKIELPVMHNGWGGPK